MNPDMIALAAGILGLVTLVAGARVADTTTARADRRGRPDPRFRINQAALSHFPHHAEALVTA